MLTPALGIGAIASIFSVVESVHWKPLPYLHSERLATLRHSAPGLHFDDLNLAASSSFTYLDESRACQDDALWNAGAATVAGLAGHTRRPIHSGS